MANPWKKVDIGILTVIPVELDAVKRALGVPDESSPEPNPTRTLSYYFVKIVSIRDRRTYTIAIGVIGRAGNYTAGAAAGVCIQDCAPECMMLVGICAGVRGKIKIGEVALPEHVLAYEGGVAVQEADDTSTLRPRVTQTRRPDLTNQWVSVYASDKDARERARRRFHDQQGWEFPSAPAGKRSEFAQNVAGAITFSSDVTIASGEKLLRDATKLDVLRAKIHDKTIIGDMESAGFVEACNKHGKPWVIVRGVSDFGDAFKDDQFHRFAARSAAVVLYDFIVHGANIRGRARWITAAFVALASLVVGALFVSFAWSLRDPRIEGVIKRRNVPQGDAVVQLRKCKPQPSSKTDAEGRFSFAIPRECVVPEYNLDVRIRDELFRYQARLPADIELGGADPAPTALALKDGMALVEGGMFTMGSWPEEIDEALLSCGPSDGCERAKLERETPAHPVTVKSFLMDLDEVKFKDFLAWVKASPGTKIVDNYKSTIKKEQRTQEIFRGDGHTLLWRLRPDVSRITLHCEGQSCTWSGPTDREGAPADPDHDEYPAVGVTWQGAALYCQHAGKRLPIEAEWELAARGFRGVDKSRFPWGDKAPVCGQVNFARAPNFCGMMDKASVLGAVGGWPGDRSAKGIHDLGGSVQEWVLDLHRPGEDQHCTHNCDDSAAVDASQTQAARTERVIRGGSYGEPAWACRSTRRTWNEAGEGYPNVGFRCVLRE